MYTAKSTYLALYNLRRGIHDIDIFKCLWKLKIPRNVSFMLCKFFMIDYPPRLIFNVRVLNYKMGDLSCVFCNELE